MTQESVENPQDIDFEAERRRGAAPSQPRQNPVSDVLGHVAVNAVDDAITGGSSAAASSGSSGSVPFEVGTAENGGTMMSDGTVSGGGNFYDPGSTAGVVSSAIRGGKTAYDYFGHDGYEKDRNRDAIVGGSMAVADYFTGGLAEVGKYGAEKILGPKLSKKAESLYVNQVPLFHVMNALGSKKNEDQVKRDQIRKNLKGSGGLDENYQLTTIDGHKVNIGLDGGARPDYASADGSRRGFEVNTDNPLSPQATSLANLLATAVAGGDPKLQTQYAGYFANASMVGAKDINGVRANLQKFATDMGLTREQLAGMVDEMKKGGKLNDQGYGIMMNSVNQVFGAAPQVKQPTGGGTINYTFNAPRAQPLIIKQAPQRLPIPTNPMPAMSLGTDDQGRTRPVVPGAPQISQSSYMPRFVPGSMAPQTSAQQPQRQGVISKVMQR